jgi:hypothetical protein
MSKPRSDSKLFTLQEDLQREIFKRMKYSGYDDVRLWVKKEHGISISNAALSNAWQEWSRKELEERVLKSKGAAEDVLALIDNPEQLDAALALALKQSAFEMVMQGGDAKTVKSFCTILLNSEKLKQDDKRIALQERRLKQAEEAEGVVKDNSLTPEDREKRMKEIFGL